MSVNQFKEEATRLAKLDIMDEKVLRVILERLIERIEVAEDGSITMQYNFKKLYKTGRRLLRWRDPRGALQPII